MGATDLRKDMTTEEKMLKVIELKAEGKTYKQIGKEIGITETYVKQLMFEARKIGKVPPYQKPEKKEKGKGGRPKGTKTPPVIEGVIMTDGKPHSLTAYGNNKVLQTIGDERVSAFVQYHIDMTKMRIGVNKRDVPDLYRRFGEYLEYCAIHNVIPSNSNCYYALGINRFDISHWNSGDGTVEQKRFAEDITAFFASVHEQGALDGLVNPIYSMWLQKAHDSMIEASKVDAPVDDPYGTKQSAEDIASKYAGVELPD